MKKDKIRLGVQDHQITKINFNSSFNNYRGNMNDRTSVLEMMIKKQPLKKVLSQESFLIEYKKNQAQAAEYFNYDRVIELINFLVKVDPQDDKQFSKKCPFVACQLLCSDSQGLTNYFFSEDLKNNTIQDNQQIDYDKKDQDQSKEKKEASKVPKRAIIKEVLNQMTDSSEDENKQTKTQILEAINEYSTLPAKETEQTTTQVEKHEKIESQKEQKIIQNNQQTQAQNAKTKNVMKKKNKQQKIISPHQVLQDVDPLFKNLMKYFDGELNYTLAGYVCKVLIFFCGKKTQCIQKLFYKEFIDKMLNHISSRSVGELLLKLLTFEIRSNIEDRINLIKTLLEKLSNENNGVEMLSNLSSYLVEFIERIVANQKNVATKSNHFQSFLQAFNLEQLLQNTMSDKKYVSAYNAPVFYSCISNMVFYNYKGLESINQEKLLQQFIKKSINKLNDIKAPKLGLGRAKIIQLLRTFILKQKQNVKDKENNKDTQEKQQNDISIKLREIIGKNKEFFPTLFSIMKRFPLNNMLHNDVIRILVFALRQPKEQPLNESLFVDDILLNFMLEVNEEDKKTKLQEKRRNGYIAHILQLSLTLQDLATNGNNSLIKALVKGDGFKEFANIVKNKVDTDEKNLAGFEIKREQKCQVFFSKEKILEKYAEFLNPTPIVPTPNIWNEQRENDECIRLLIESKSNYLEYDVQSLLKEQ